MHESCQVGQVIDWSVDMCEGCVDVLSVKHLTSCGHLNVIQRPDEADEGLRASRDRRHGALLGGLGVLGPLACDATGPSTGLRNRAIPPWT